MATHSNGISALQLQRQLGLGSYRSAWLLCGKLRRSMVAPGRSALAGLIEVDETEIPCRRKNDPLTGGGGRSHQGKMLIVGAVEVADSGAGPGRIRLAEVPDYSAQSLHPFIAQNLAPGATAKTDGWSAYPGAPSVKHDPHVVGKMAAHIVLPWVHRIFSNLKVWALGVYHGLRRKHLQSYLDEFVFPSTAAAPDTLRSAPCLASPSATPRVEEAAMISATNLWLYTWSAEQVYAKLGWQRVGPSRDEARGIDVVLMKRNLSKL